MAELIAEHTGQTVEQIEKDSDRDRWFTAEEAKEYGFVDHVFSQRRPGAGGGGGTGRLTTAAMTEPDRSGDTHDSNTPYGGLHGAPARSSRYILPQFEERTSYGMKRLDPYTKLFEDRIIFLGVQVDDASADDIIAQLIVLESQDPDRDILMYINSARWLVHRA